MSRSTVPASRRIRARVWRMFIRLRYMLWQRHRHGHLVLEKGLGMPLVVMPDVFNPTLFRTTPFVLGCLGEGLVPDGARVLDLGTGSGALALAAAGKAAKVTAVDLNPQAVRCARINVLLNGLEDSVDVREGDLFEPVSGESFDLVLCNPPYYEGEPASDRERAFYAGDFAQRLASGLATHLTADGQALIVLSSDGVEVEFLEALRGEGLDVGVVRSRDLISEVVTLYRVERSSSG